MDEPRFNLGDRVLVRFRLPPDAFNGYGTITRVGMHGHNGVVSINVEWDDQSGESQFGQEDFDRITVLHVPEFQSMDDADQWLEAPWQNQ